LDVAPQTFREPRHVLGRDERRDLLRRDVLAALTLLGSLAAHLADERLERRQHRRRALRNRRQLGRERLLLLAQLALGLAHRLGQLAIPETRGFSRLGGGFARRLAQLRGGALQLAERGLRVGVQQR
jgi:hypothetical protein